MADTRDLFVQNEVLELRKDGLWYSNGEEVTHAGTVHAFFAGLRRDTSGWIIRIGRESKPVTVEDTAYFVTSLIGTTESGFIVRLSDAAEEALDPSTLRYRTGRLTCTLANGEEARFLRVPYMDLMRHLQQECDGYYVVVKDRRYKLAGLESR